MRVLAVAALAVATIACTDDDDTAGVDAGSDAPETCAGAGIGKGPWALHVDGSSAVVRWEACRAGTSPTLSLTPEKGGASRSVDAVATEVEIINTYVAAFLPQVPADLAGTYTMHEATLDGLDASSCYRYELAQDPQAKGRFCTAKNPGDPLKLLAIADTNPGLGTNLTELLPQLVGEGFDFTIHGGDIQYYASGLETWASWFPAMAPMLRQGAFFPAIGNHEHEKEDEYDQYTSRFFGNAGFDGSAYYRFESGGVWFFALDTEDSIEPGSSQFEWFADRLADAASQPGYRFSVVYMHRPLLTCGDTSQNDSARQALEVLFDQHTVPLVIQGHMHGYERFVVPTVDPTATRTYVTSAGGGGALGNIDENIDRPTCSMRVASGAFHHGLILEVGTGEIRGKAIAKDGAQKDTFTQAAP